MARHRASKTSGRGAKYYYFLIEATLVATVLFVIYQIFLPFLY